MDIGDLRAPYGDEGDRLRETDLVSKDPVGQFKHWLEQVFKSGQVKEPNAMCLASATKSGIPSCRMVLLKKFSDEGFTFYTHGISRKGTELIENPRAALLFYWGYCNRQVRIEGPVLQTPMEEAEEYFHSRPRNSQLSAAISEQSAVVRLEDLILKYQIASEKHSDKNLIIPKPNSWGGFKVVPESIEFWQGQSNRLHDRIRFRRQKPGELIDNDKVYQGDNGWVYERLSP